MIERSLVVCVFILSQGKISKPFGMLDPKLGYHSLITWNIKELFNNSVP